MSPVIGSSTPCGFVIVVTVITESLVEVVVEMVVIITCGGFVSCNVSSAVSMFLVD